MRFPMTRVACAAGISALFLAKLCHAQVIDFQMAENHLDIRVAGDRIATYVWSDAQIPRPYFANLMAPNGVPVTRTHPPDPVADAENDDHASFHPGVWLAFGDLGGADFWRNKARVRHVRFTQAPSVEDKLLQFAVLNVYETTDNPPRVLCEEAARYTLRLTPEGYLLTSDSVFTPKKEGLSFGDQEEMGFGIRLATPLTVRHGKGRIWNSEGGKNESGTWGEQALWCAGGAEIGGIQVGAVVMASPNNLRPAWFHSRDYGLIVANPFGKKAMTGPEDNALKPASTPMTDDFRLGFAVGVFSARSPIEQAAEALYQVYTSDG